MQLACVLQEVDKHFSSPLLLDWLEQGGSRAQPGSVHAPCLDHLIWSMPETTREHHLLNLPGTPGHQFLSLPLRLLLAESRPNLLHSHI